LSRTGGARRDQPFVVVPTAPTGRLPRSSSKPEARPGRRRRAEALRSDGARPPNPQRLVDARTDLRRPWAAPDTSSVSCWYGRCCSRALAARALREARGPRWRCDRRGLRPSAHACHFPYRGPQALEAFTSRGGAICQWTAGIPRGRTGILQVGGQQFSKWADRNSPSGRPGRRPLQLVLLGTGARSQLAGATTGCLSGDVLGHSCPPASPGSLSARR
jgi:hypothetical protein